MNRRAFAGLAFSLSLLACADEDSQKLETNQIRVSYYVEHQPSEPEVLHLQAHPYQGSSLKGVDLNDGDRVEVTTNAMATPLVLRRGPIGGYFGDLPKGDHREVTFSLIRSEKTSAPATKVGVLPLVAFETDPEGLDVSYASGVLELRWSNPTAGAEFVLDFAQPCGSASASATTGKVPDDPSWDATGTLVIPSALLSPTPPPAAGACISVYLKHILSGTIDPALEALSTAESLQTFSFDINLVP